MVDRRAFDAQFPLGAVAACHERANGVALQLDRPVHEIVQRYSGLVEDVPSRHLQVEDQLPRLSLEHTAPAVQDPDRHRQRLAAFQLLQIDSRGHVELDRVRLAAHEVDAGAAGHEIDSARPTQPERARHRGRVFPTGFELQVQLDRVCRQRGLAIDLSPALLVLHLTDDRKAVGALDRRAGHRADCIRHCEFV
eukprot:2668435-Rhodomonas_salina.1